MINLQEIWFDENQPIKKNTDIVFYQQVGSNYGIKSEEFTTLTIDLEQLKEEIFAGFAKNNRYEISRADKKDELSVNYYTYPIEDNVIEDLCNDYNKFADSRSKGKLTPLIFKNYNENKMLIISNVLKNDKVLVWHTYIVNGVRARLKTSNSIFTEKSNEERNLIGRANRYLHWEDIQYFKNMNFKIYDFGGFYTGEDDKKLLGINAFKKSFGGVLEESYNYTLAKTLKGRIYLLLSKLKNKLK